MAHKLTIVHTGKPEITLSEFVQCARKKDLDVEVRRVSNDMIQSGEVMKILGDGVLWRIAEIGPGGLAIFYGAMGDKLTINPALYILPELADKFFQQGLLLYSDLASYGIETFRIGGGDDARRYMQQGKLKYPFVVKPTKGYSAIGLRLIGAEEDMRGIGGGMVAQPYIMNSGEWRVFVVGGVGIGAMRKEAGMGEPFNIVRKGALIYKETNSEVLEKLNEIACRASSMFSLGCAGVDITQDDRTGDFKVFEVNLSPGWQNGWDEVTGESVPDEVMDWYIERWELKDGKLDLDVILKKYLEKRQKWLSREKRALLGKDVEYDFEGSLEEWEKTLKEDYFNNKLEEKLKYVYFATKEGRRTDLAEMILEEAKKSVSWAGNFLVDLNDKTPTGLSLAHSLEEGALATMLYIKVCEMRRG